MGKIAEVQEVTIADLIPYANNAKIHGAGQIEKLKKSITEFGFITPCLIDRENNLIAGHGRVMAAKELGMTTVPCVYVDGLTETQRRAYILADNRLGELGEWNMDLVFSELEELKDMDFDIELTGFELPDDEPNEVEDDGYDFKDVVDHRASEGDVWQLGEHRLMCGDSSSREDVEKLTGGVRAKMVFTDPPYGVAIGTKNQTLNAFQPSGRQTENIIGDTLSTEELYEMLKAVFINLREHAEEDCSYYVTSPQGGEIGLMMMMMMRDAGLEVRHNLIWEKNTATFSMRRLDYDYQHEPIFYTWTKKHNYYGKGQYHTTIWKFDKPRKCDLHPTMKPIELVAEALLNSSLENDPVFDFFGGSGTTLMACEQLHRKCFMMEKDPKFVDVILDRWEKTTGNVAIKVE